ncbi:MAG: response regulator [Syntrophaceae bacterium]|nr:response regulator [Syntrophaceae bacterium]
MMDDKNRMLIIGEDEQMGFLLKDFLQKEGVEVEHVKKCTYVFKKLLTESFALILTDIRMRRFNGLDILTGLRKLQPEPPIIVITTAFGGEEVQHEAHEKGATAYLEKPIHFPKLRTLIYENVS